MSKKNYYNIKRNISQIVNEVYPEETANDSALCEEDGSLHVELPTSSVQADGGALSDHEAPNENVNMNLSLIDGECGVSLINSSHMSEDSFKSFLRKWALKYNVTHVSLNDLLKGYANHHPGSDLPLDARTLLKTRRNIVCEEMSDGMFVYMGIEEGIRKTILQSNCEDSTLNLIVNVDGATIYNSTDLNIWPILGIIEGVKRSPFVIAIFAGSSKPPLEEYFAKFIAELNSLTIHGVTINEVLYNIKLKCFVCDAVARQYIKKCKGHAGYYSCEKCCVKGFHNRENKSISFADINAPLRTDESFLAMANEERHTSEESTPLIGASVGMVTQFPLEYMHLVLSGVMRRLLFMWVKNMPHKLSRHTISKLDSDYVSLKHWVPCDFSRKPRSLKQLKNFKATEFRLFLLYLGPVLLKKVLPDKQYRHFLLLACGIRILCSNEDVYSSLSIQFANKLLRKFVEKYNIAYPDSSVVYNIHSLIHLSADVERMGGLEVFSAFPFETYLNVLKNKVRSGNRALVQICKRLFEYEDNAEDCNVRKSIDSVIKPKYDKESCIFLKDGSYGIVTSVNKPEIKVRLFKDACDIFSEPCKSSDVGMVKFKRVSKHETSKLYDDIAFKCLYIRRKYHVVIRFVDRFS